MTDGQHDLGGPATFQQPGPSGALITVAVDRPGPTVAVVHVEGEIDLATAATVHDELWRELSGSNKTVVLDLTGVSFMGSAGLSELVAAEETAQDNGIALTVVATNRAVLRPIEVSGLASVLRITGTVDQALSSQA